MYSNFMNAYMNLNIQWSKKCFSLCNGNSGFSHDLIFKEVSEWDDIGWFIISVQLFVSCLVRDNVLSTFKFNAVLFMSFSA